MSVEIVKLSSIAKEGDVFVDILSDSHQYKGFDFIAWKNKRVVDSANSTEIKFEDFLIRVKNHVSEGCRIVVDDLEFDFDELAFREKE